MLAQLPCQLLGDRPRRRQQDPAACLAGLAEAREAGEDVLLDLRAEALQPADLLRLRRLLEVVEGGDPELLEEAAGGLGAEPRHAGDLDQRGRVLGLQLGRRRDLAGLDQGVDLFRKGLADAWDLGRPAGRRELGDGDRAFANRLRRGAVGEHPVFDGPVELVEDAKLLQGSRDLGVGHTRQANGRRYHRP